MEYFFMNSVLSLWLPLAPFGSPWRALGLPLPVLQGPFGEPLGHIGNFIENWTSFTEKCVKFTKLYSKHSFWEFAPGATGAPGASGSGVMKCCSDLPSTRAGGQDDGSKQTPSN